MSAPSSATTTTAAAANAARARRAWREHVGDCVQCANQGHKRPAVRLLCSPGAELRAELVGAERALDLAREADAREIPGQLELYGDVCHDHPQRARPL